MTPPRPSALQGVNKETLLCFRGQQMDRQQTTRNSPPAVSPPLMLYCNQTVPVSVVGTSAWISEFNNSIFFVKLEHTSERWISMASINLYTVLHTHISCCQAVAKFCKDYVQSIHTHTQIQTLINTYTHFPPHNSFSSTNMHSQQLVRSVVTMS